jgi:hypothetical protein
VAQVYNLAGATRKRPRSFAFWAKGRVPRTRAQQGLRRTDKSCAGSIASHPCKKRKDGHPRREWRTQRSLKLDHSPMVISARGVTGDGHTEAGSDFDYCLGIAPRRIVTTCSTVRLAVSITICSRFHGR